MNWQTVKLGEVTEILSGFAFDSTMFNTHGEGLPLARIRDVVRGFSETYYSGSYDERYLVSDGDTLIGMDGEFNRAKWKSEKALLNQRVCRICACGKLDGGFLFYFLPAALKKIEDVTPFVTVKHLSVKQIRDIEIPLPPLSEQQRLASILDKADAVRRLRAQMLQRLDELVAALFSDMFGDPLAQVSQKKAPEGATSLGNVVELVMGQSPPGTSYNDQGKGQPLLNGPTEFGMRYPIEKQWTTEPTKLCEDGDILFCVRGATAGRLNIADKTYCLGRGVAAIRMRPFSTVSREFVYFVLQIYYPYFQATGNGSTFINISGDDLRRLPIPLPPLPLQQQFAERVEAIETLKATARAALLESDALFGALQERAFCGEL